MLKNIRQLATYLAPPEEVPEDDAPDKRHDSRFPFDGVPFPARIDKIQTTLRLKDLSRGGVAGLLDEPVAVGDILYVEFDERHVVEAEVRWVRRIMVGLKFTWPLDGVFVQGIFTDYAIRSREQEDEE